MNMIVRKMPWEAPGMTREQALFKREWLVTNGLGGYAAGTVSGAVTRRYHGYLIAALPSPHGRTVMFNYLSELIKFQDGSVAKMAALERGDGSPETYGMEFLKEFRLEQGLPVWEYQIGDTVIEKRVFLIHMQNTVHIQYRLLKGDKVRLKLQPALQFRPHEGPVAKGPTDPYIVTALENRYQITNGRKLPPLRMVIKGDRAAFTLEEKIVGTIFYRIEYNRGYEHTGEMWSPGYFAVDLVPGEPATLIASTEKWEIINALQPVEALASEFERRRLLLDRAHPLARKGVAAELVFAADQFLITPAGRQEDAARARATGDEIRTVIAGYHWFTDWGRDTMISLEGLTLSTGRKNEAGWILRTFAHYVKDGLIPNMFPEGKNDGLYHTADATPWFFHALDRYLEATDDRGTLELVMPKLKQIMEKHFEGTRFGIGIDPEDGLLKQGAQGYQLTWMDAKVAEWVVTPRRGKSVETNALFYNALKLMEKWVGELEGEEQARWYAEQAARLRESFNRRFWYAEGGYLYDVVDGEEGDDTSCRPNQIFSLALRHPVLDEDKWAPVMDVVSKKLLTPVGLRTLSRENSDYKEKYFGDLRSRDAAYHQGTVWPWLIGPFINAWLKLNPGKERQARQFLEGLIHSLNDKCIGSLNEVYDAEAPYSPRGCVAQAWSVAEMLRCWILTEGG